MNKDVLITAFAMAGAGFILSKVIFGCLGWYTQLGADALYRSRLDRLWDALHNLGFSELSQRALVRLVAKLDAMLVDRRRVILIFFAASAVINFFSLVLGAAIFFHIQDMSLADIFSEDTPIVGFLAVFVLVPLMGCLFDIISAWVTIALLRHASRNPKITVLAWHAGADLVVAGFALLWVAFCVGLVASFLEIDKSVIESFMFQLEMLHEGLRDFFNGLNTDASANAIVYLILGSSTALPTLAYLTIWVALVIVWSLPEALKPYFRNIIYLVTTDNKPVLSQLGTFFGGCAAILGALVAIIKT